MMRLIDLYRRIYHSEDIPIGQLRDHDALVNGVYDNQGGPRGGNKTFVSGMFMCMAERPLGDGTFGLRNGRGVRRFFRTSGRTRSLHIPSRVAGFPVNWPVSC
jgi:hypothetical protein